MVLLYRPISPWVAAADTAAFLVPAAAFAGCLSLLTVEPEGKRLRLWLGRVGISALVLYAFLAAFRVALERAPGGQAGLLGAALAVGGFLGLLLLAEERRAGVGPGGPKIGPLRTVLRKALGWVEAVPRPLWVAAVGALIVLATILLSPYALVLGAASAVGMAVALVVRAVRRMPVARSAVAALAALAVTGAFAATSHGLYLYDTRGGAAGTEGRQAASPGVATDGAATDSTPSANHSDPVDVYLSEDDPQYANGHLLVNRRSGRYLVYFNGGIISRGNVGPNDQLFDYLMPSIVAGDLDASEYVCTYDAADPEGGQAAMQRACGSPSKQARDGPRTPRSGAVLVAHQIGPSCEGGDTCSIEVVSLDANAATA